MLSSLFGPDLIFRLIALTLGFAVHEFGHAVVALWLGDDTPKRQGRVSLNPLSHLDLIGLLLGLLFYFGWAKPVVFNPGKIKGNKALGIILISLAGPAMNALLALVSIVVIFFLAPSANAFGQVGFGNFIYSMFSELAIYNIALTIFNLIPIPPLDGWKVLLFMMPRRMFYSLTRIERFGPILLLLILIVPYQGLTIGGHLINGTLQTVLGWFGLTLGP